MSNVQVIKKQVEFEGVSYEALMFEVSGQQAITITRLSTLLGVHQTTINEMVKTHLPELKGPTLELVKSLRDRKLIAGTGMVPRLLYKDHVWEIVRRMTKTPRANEIFRQMYESAEENVVNKAKVAKLETALVHERQTVDAMIEAAVAEAPKAEVLQYRVTQDGHLAFNDDFFLMMHRFQQEQKELIAAEFARAEAEKLRADNAEAEYKKASNLVSLTTRKLEAKAAEIQDRQSFAVQYALADTLTARDIFDLKGGIRRYAMILKSRQQHLAFTKDFNDAAWVSHYLRTKHGLYAKIQEVMDDIARYLYNKADIEAVESLCQDQINEEVEAAKTGVVPKVSKSLRALTKTMSSE